MKALLAGISLFCAVHVYAIPVQHIEISQNNWFLRLLYDFTDSTTGDHLVVDEVYWNGHLAYTDISGYVFNTTLPASGLPNSLAVFGENHFSIVENGVTYDGPTFTLTQPTGEAPASSPVPDGGETIILLLFAFGLLVVVRGLHAVTGSESSPHLRVLR